MGDNLIQHEKNLFSSASGPFGSEDPGPWHSCWAGVPFSSLLRRQKVKALYWKWNWYHISTQASSQEAHYWKYLGFLELKDFFSYLIFHSLFCWFNVCFLLSQLVKLGWSVKLSRDWRFHFQGLKVWVWAFENLDKDNQGVRPSRG